ATKSYAWVVAALSAVAYGTRRTSRLLLRKAALARSWIQAVTSVSAGPPLVVLYFKPPSLGGLCEGGITMPAAQAVLAATVVTQDGVGDDGRGRKPIVALDHRRDAVGGQHFQGGSLGRVGQGMGIFTHEERSGNALRSSIITNPLSDGQNVGFRERG